ncbi:MAG: hypothetical protein J7621_29590, partial [Niastella sp.]|nr:hypothetical protein [Niastella sp.]
MNPSFNNRPDWVKGRGYLHITPKLDILRRYNEILSKIQDEKFVAKHGFFPLIHAVIKERKYKKSPYSSKRGHSYLNNHGIVVGSAKQRPLHYATHIDSLIFGYYAELIMEKYNTELEKYPSVKESVIAYRKIPIERDGAQTDIGKSTIHFAHEAFQEIKKRSLTDDCTVLMFDIKSFFSEIDHPKLKEAWCKP